MGDDLPAEAFYDDLAEDYHLILPTDLDVVAEIEGDVLGRLLPPPPARVLDASCGIGTQVLGLAPLGYDVVGRDLSEKAVERAIREAGTRGLAIDLAVADMRVVDEAVDGRFAAALICDNSIAHLPTDDDLARTFGAIRRVLDPGGTLLATTWDYDALATERVVGVPGRLHEDQAGRRIVTQAWEWSPTGDTLRIHHVVAKDEGGSWATTVRVTTMRAWKRGEVTALLRAAGFDDVRWLAEEESGWYQPIVLAR